MFTFRLPPLRERVGDILPLARDILVRQHGVAVHFSPEAQRALLDHQWPGNIRELANAMRHAAALARGSRVELSDLPDDIVAPGPGPTGVRVSDPSPGASSPFVAMEPLAEVERRHILAVLRACGGNQAEAARVLGIARNTLWRKLEGFRHEQDSDAAPHPSGC